MICIDCGRELKDDAKFCDGCGTKVEPTQKNKSNDENSPQNIIKEIVDNRTIDIYNQPKIFKSILANYLVRDKETLKYLHLILDYNAGEKLYNAKDFDDSKFQEEIKKIAMQIHGETSMPIDMLEKGLAILSIGLGKDFIAKVISTEATSTKETPQPKQIIKENAINKAVGLWGETALILASKDGKTDEVDSLISRGADVNAKTWGGYTSLIEASYNGHTEIVKKLIAAGANLNAKSILGESALYLASQYGHTEIVRLLKEAGAK